VTRTTARRAGIAWLVLAIATIPARIALEVLGIDGWYSTLAGLCTICLGLSMWHAGWLRGHGARADQ
jgi:hypothetical protein